MSLQQYGAVAASEAEVREEGERRERMRSRVLRKKRSGEGERGGENGRWVGMLRSVMRRLGLTEVGWRASLGSEWVLVE